MKLGRLVRTSVALLVSISAASAQPVNDSCSGAEPIFEGLFPWSNVGTVADGTGSCLTGSIRDVWFLYTASNSGQARITTCGAQGTVGDTVLVIYDASFGCPTPASACLAADDDSCSGASGSPASMAEVRLSVMGGNQYYIQVGGPTAAVGTSELLVELEVAPATDISSVDMGGYVAVSWSPSTGGAGQTAQNIYIDGSLAAAEVPLTVDTWSVPYPPGATTTIEVCVETVFGAQVSELACTIAGVGGPQNDNCTSAKPLQLGVSEAGSLALASLDAMHGCGTLLHEDVWYRFTSPRDGLFTIGTCGSALADGTDTLLALYEVCGGDPIDCAPGDGGICISSGGSSSDAALEHPMVAGETVLIRVTAVAGTEFILLVEESCEDPGVATCLHDSVTGTVLIEWPDNPTATSGFQILENGVVIGSVPGGSISFMVPEPTPGLTSYEVAWLCSVTGGPGESAHCTVLVPTTIPDGTTDIVFNLDAQDGDTGLLDSGAAITAGLLELGLAPLEIISARITPLEIDFAASDVSRIWVCSGSFPSDNRLSEEDGDLLATLNATNGIAVYFESSDHWGHDPVPSDLDARDGVVRAFDGGDTFTNMRAVTEGGDSLLPAMFPGVIPYNSNQLGNDSIDKLDAEPGDMQPGDPEVTVARCLWADGDEVSAITTVYSEHTTGANMIVSSWLLGGFGGEITDLITRYVALLGGVPPPALTPDFVRGEGNGDGVRNIADVIFLLRVLFPLGVDASPSCDKALDSNDDGGVHLADAVALLLLLFPSDSPSPELPAPNECGQDPTPDLLDCAAYLPAC